MAPKDGNEAGTYVAHAETLMVRRNLYKMEGSLMLELTVEKIMGELCWWKILLRSTPIVVFACNYVRIAASVYCGGVVQQD
jgi:hypothetical protein